MSANSFLERNKVTKVKDRYLTAFHKIDELEQSLDNYLPLTGGTLTGNLAINTSDLTNNSFSITASSGNTIRNFEVGNSLSYLFQTTSNNVTSENKLLIDTTGITLKNLPNEKISLTQTNITIQNRSGSKIENDIQGGYINLYTHSGNYLYFGAFPNTNNRYVDWNSGPFKIQSTGSQTKIHHGDSQYMTLGYETGFCNGNDYAKFLKDNTLLAIYKSGTNSNYFTIGGTNINWQGAQKASYSNPNYDTVDFRMDQNSFDYTGNWYSTQSATNPVQLRIYSGINHELLYISHSAPNENRAYFSIHDETYDTTMSIRCDNGSNYSIAAISGGGISLNKGLNNSFTHFSAGSGNLETSNNYTGFRFNLTDTSKTKGLTAFKANGVDIDFTIEGFHDIVNDKFTLSSTYDTSALTTALTQDEIDWIDANSKDILAMIMDIKRSGSGTDVVTRAEYNALLDAYNDLAERLNQFLLTTGNVTPTPTGNFINITFTEDNLDTSIEIGNQHANDDYTINWGDNTNSLSDDGNIYHEYSSPGDYIITLTANNEDSAGILAIYGGEIGEVYLEDIDLRAPMGTKITIDNSMLYNGSGTAFWWEDNEITEIHIKEHCIIPANNDCLINDCPNLTKVIIDAPIISTYDGEYYLIKDCPNLTELYLTNSTLPNILNGTLFNTIPNNIIIYVPNALLNDYQVAFPDYATYMVGE